MLYVKTVFDLSADDITSGRISLRVTDVDWDSFRTKLENSILSSDLIVRADLVKGNNTYSFQYWTTREAYDAFVSSVNGDDIRNKISEAGIGVERFESEEYTLDDVINDIETIAGDTYIHWRSGDPSIESRGT